MMTAARGVLVIWIALGASCSKSADSGAQTVEQVLPGIVSESGISRAYPAFAPDGRLLALARYREFGGDAPVSIEIARRVGEGWSAPATAPFSGAWHDHQPNFSPDGRYLYFVSKRPVDGAPREDTEIWRIAVRGEEWGDPEHLASVGGPGNEYAPCVARSGALYFSSDREGGYGSGDLYVAMPAGDGFAAPANLGAPVNGESGEWGMALDPDERLLLFESSDRRGNLSESGDLWVSRRADGRWQEPRHLEPPINSTSSDLAPRFLPGGDRIVFSSNRHGAVATYEAATAALLAEAP